MSVVSRYKTCVEKLLEAYSKNSININTNYDGEESISQEALFVLIYESNKLLYSFMTQALNDCVEIVGSTNDSGDIYTKVYMDFKDSEGNNIFINTEIVLKGYDLVQKTNTLGFQIGQYLITVNENGYKVEEVVNATNSSSDDHNPLDNSTIHGDL